MPFGSGGGGGAFNGGTITQPLVVDLGAGAGTQTPLTLRIPYGSQIADTLHVLNADSADAVVTALDSAAAVQLNAGAGTLNTVLGTTGLGSGLNNSISANTAAFVSGTARQLAASLDVYLVVPVTFNPTAGAAATCKVEVSPDNAVFSTLVTLTEPPGLALDGTIMPVVLLVRASWYVKLTVTNATLGTGTYY